MTRSLLAGSALLGLVACGDLTDVGEVDRLTYDAARPDEVEPRVDDARLEEVEELDDETRWTWEISWSDPDGDLEGGVLRVVSGSTSWSLELDEDWAGEAGTGAIRLTEDVGASFAPEVHLVDAAGHVGPEHDLPTGGAR